MVIFAFLLLFLINNTRLAAAIRRRLALPAVVAHLLHGDGASNKVARRKERHAAEDVVDDEG